MLSTSSPGVIRLVQRALVSGILVVGVLVGGCDHTDRELASFDWPDDVDCPGVEVAVLYLGHVIPSCRGELVSIDAPPEHHEGQCRYEVTIVSGDDCNQHF
jgi:hypothetical protein